MSEGLRSFDYHLTEYRPGDLVKMSILVIAPAPVQPQSDPAERAWTVMQNTTSVAVLEDFIRQFGSTIFGSMARARLEELKKSQVAIVAPPVVIICSSGHPCILS